MASTTAPSYEKGKTALILVDPINDFLAEGESTTILAVDFRHSLTEVCSFQMAKCTLSFKHHLQSKTSSRI
jgi:hypothetical protein